MADPDWDSQYNLDSGSPGKSLDLNHLFSIHLPLQVLDMEIIEERFPDRKKITVRGVRGFVVPIEESFLVEAIRNPDDGIFKKIADGNIGISRSILRKGPLGNRTGVDILNGSISVPIINDIPQGLRERFNRQSQRDIFFREAVIIIWFLGALRALRSLRFLRSLRTLRALG